MELLTVPRERVEAFVRRLERLAAAHQDGRGIEPTAAVCDRFAEADRLLLLLEQGLMQQRALVAQLSTPVFELGDHVVCASLCGRVDSASVADLGARLVSAVLQHHARVVILDLCATAEIDERGSTQLLKLVRGFPELDVRPVLAGAPPHVTRRLAAQDPTLAGAQIAGSLKEAVRACLPRG